MNDIQVFSNEKFGQVRTVMQDGEPWFVAADVCRDLEIGNTAQAVSRLDDDEKMTIKINDSHSGTRGGAQMMTIVNEMGLYSLVLGSRKKEAKDFKRWITHEVIPTIRKTGGYVHNSEVFIQNYLPFADDTTKQLFRLTLDVVDKQNKQIAEQQKEIAEKSSVIEEMTPKATYYDVILASPSLMTTTAIAKDFGLTANRLNKILQEHRIQFKQGKTWYLYDEFAKRGYAQSKTYSYKGKEYPDWKATWSTQWTQPGRRFIYELLKGMGILPIVEREAV